MASRGVWAGRKGAGNPERESRPGVGLPFTNNFNGKGGINDHRNMLRMPNHNRRETGA